MFDNNIYKAKVYGIDESFKLNSNNLRHEIYLNKKSYLTTIYVYKYLNGYKEIITGKYFSKYKKEYIGNYELLFKRGENKIIPCKAPIFIIDDLDALRGNNLSIASNKEVIKYIDEKDYNVVKTTLDFLEDICYKYLDEATLKYKEETNNLKLLKRMK